MHLYRMFLRVNLLSGQFGQRTAQAVISLTDFPLSKKQKTLWDNFQ